METLARKNLDMTAVSEMPLFRGISVFELTRMADIMDIRLLRYERGEMIQERGGAVRKVRVITNGLVCADLLDAEDPAEWERNCLGAGAVLGLDAVFSAERISPVGFMAASRTCELVCFDPLLLPDKDVPAHIRMRFAENCLNLLADRAVGMSCWTQVLSRRSLEDKILAFVRIMCQKNGSCSFVLHMKQSEFASYLRVSRPSLSRALGVLKQKGILAVKGRTYTVLQVPRAWANTWPKGVAIKDENDG